MPAVHINDVQCFGMFNHQISTACQINIFTKGRFNLLGNFVVVKNRGLPTVIGHDFFSAGFYFANEVAHFCRNGFIIDNYSRFIVGWSVSDGLKTEQTTLRALKLAVKRRGGVDLTGLIFHSDGGGQYYAKSFLAYTREKNMVNSMCEYAYENGKAERVNGIIKNNYLRPWGCSNKAELVKNVDRACTNYNNEKPHKAIKMISPLEFERKCLTLNQQARPKVTESFTAINSQTGHRAPL